MLRYCLAAMAALCLAGPLRADPLSACFDLASRSYGVSASLLRAVAMQESRMNPLAFNRNRNGSWDAGLMQINSSWLPVLRRHGIQMQDLWDPCTSVMVGAWIMGANFRTMGVTTQALGAYNAAHPVLRETYARKILARLQADASRTEFQSRIAERNPYRGTDSSR
jgi:soluble lytic murein transglycosylase-like protein